MNLCLLWKFAPFHDSPTCSYLDTNDQEVTILTCFLYNLNKPTRSKDIISSGNKNELTTSLCTELLRRRSEVDAYFRLMALGQHLFENEGGKIVT